MELAVAGVKINARIFAVGASCVNESKNFSHKSQHKVFFNHGPKNTWEITFAGKRLLLE